MDTSAKIMTQEQLGAWRAGLPRKAGNPAVVTGAFDILQPGNVMALHHAAARGRKVCVLVGEGCSQPWRSLAERVETVSHLRNVAAVCALTSSGDAPSYLEKLKPYTHVLCEARSGDTLSAEADRLADKRKLLPELPGCSTGEIVAAIREGKTPVQLPPAFLRYSRRRKSFGGGVHVDRAQGPAPLHGNALDVSRETRGRHVVVSVNGCFDVLHVGHLRFLAQARAMGDELIVLVNDDKSVRAYKGNTRPVFPLEFRIEALLALESVSHVCPFRGDNPLKTLDLLRPHIHVKGGSFEPGRVEAERKLLERWGGSVQFCPMVENFSTTGWLEMVTGKKGSDR